MAIGSGRNISDNTEGAITPRRKIRKVPHWITNESYLPTTGRINFHKQLDNQTYLVVL
jgi:hypothetical protein